MLRISVQWRLSAFVAQLDICGILAYTVIELSAQSSFSKREASGAHTEGQDGTYHMLLNSPPAMAQGGLGGYCYESMDTLAGLGLTSIRGHPVYCAVGFWHSGAWNKFLGCLGRRRY